MCYTVVYLIMIPICAFCAVSLKFYCSGETNDEKAYIRHPKNIEKKGRQGF